MKNNQIIDADEFLGPIDLLPDDNPIWVDDGSGNGWWIYSDGEAHYCYIDSSFDFLI